MSNKKKKKITDTKESNKEVKMKLQVNAKIKDNWLLFYILYANCTPLVMGYVVIMHLAVYRC